MAKQIIKIKPADLEKTVIRGFGRSAWEASKEIPLRGQVQSSKKKKEPKYKNRFHELEQ
ncbi:MAG: hypothetical protein WC719_01805 [Patescibacteria group bacterium]|jgi:hypothetical protein